MAHHTPLEALPFIKPGVYETIGEAVPACPLCGADHPDRYEGTPYWMCGSCDFWFQSPLPPKTFESLEEKAEDGRSGGHEQPKGYLDAAAHLARCFANNWITKTPPIGREHYKVIDIGCKYPWFAATLKNEFKMDAYGVDGMDMDSPDNEPITNRYQEELGVPMLLMDFEAADPEEILKKTEDGQPFDAITMIHCFEHMYDPAKALAKLHQLLWLDGTLLLRMPSHDVEGREHHLTPAHFSIHPYFYSEKSFRALVDKVKPNGFNLFEIAETYPLGGGVRDYILKPR